MFGKEGPNKGKNKNNCERIKIAGEKISNILKEKYKNGELLRAGDKNPMFQKNPWNKDKTKYDDERIYEYGMKISRIASERWIKLTEEQKIDRIGKLTKSATMARKDTKIEMIVDECLKNLDLEYYKNYRENRYVFDFFIPKLNTIIECQGDYWHANPIKFKNKKLSETQLFNIERDKRKINFMNNNKIKHIYLWENFIYKNIKELKDIISEDLLKNENIEHL
jgi:G:T-mismatch repair DNA endonuclease (very short patch repair protein)